MADDPAWLFWRPLREGIVEGDAPPWRAARPVDRASAEDELSWLARDGDWIARIEGPRGEERPQAFVARHGEVRPLPPPEWWYGTDGELGWDPKDVRRVAVHPADADWVSAWEGGHAPPAVMAYTAALYLDAMAMFRTAALLWETRRADLVWGAHRRHLRRHAALLRALVRGETVGTREILASTECLSNHCDYLRRVMDATPDDETPAESFATLCRHFSACGVLIQAWNLAACARWSDALRAREKPEIERSGYVTACVHAVENPLMRDNYLEPDMTEAARRAIVHTVGDRLYLALSGGVWAP